MGTQGVPQGNLSLAHTKVITVASHRRILSSLTCARLLAGRFQHAHSPCPQKGGSPSSKAYSASNLAILQATSVYRAHKHGMWLVLFNNWSNGQPRTGLNRHRWGYATKEAGNIVHFPVSGPIGLARSQILISSLSSLFHIISISKLFIKDIPIL